MSWGEGPSSLTRLHRTLGTKRQQLESTTPAHLTAYPGPVKISLLVIVVFLPRFPTCRVSPFPYMREAAVGRRIRGRLVRHCWSASFRLERRNGCGLGTTRGLGICSHRVLALGATSQQDQHGIPALLEQVSAARRCLRHPSQIVAACPCQPLAHW